MKQQIIRIDSAGVNCYLLKSDEGFILVDTGGHLVLDKEFTNRREAVEQALEKNGCTKENLNLILLTHGDNDHVCNAAYLRNKYGSRIAIHKEDSHLVTGPSVEDFMRSFQYRSVFYKMVFQFMKRAISTAAYRIIEAFETFTPDIYLNEAFKLSDFGFDGSIIHVPGHTPGSIAILTKDKELIAGDLFTNLKKPETALNALDFKLLHESINKLKSYEIHMVFPGHGQPFDFKALRLKE